MAAFTGGCVKNPGLCATTRSKKAAAKPTLDLGQTLFAIFFTDLSLFFNDLFKELTHGSLIASFRSVHDDVGGTFKPPLI